MKTEMGLTNEIERAKRIARRFAALKKQYDAEVAGAARTVALRETSSDRHIAGRGWVRG